MNSDTPLLKIHADEQTSYHALKRMERSARNGGCITLLFVIALLYVVLNAIEGIRFMTLLLCVISAGMTWLTYKSIPSYLECHQKLPLLYSFHPHGFIDHKGEKEYYWDHIATLNYSETHLNLKMGRNPHKMAELGFICISEVSINQILNHFKTHAPERLSKKIEL